jgi:hypothetical protein
LNPLDPKITRFSGAPIRRKHSSHAAANLSPDNAPLNALPADTVQLRKNDPALKPDEKKKSLTRRVMEKSLQGLLLASSIVGAFTGIGVATNAKVLKEAMNQEQPIQVFGQNQDTGAKGDTDTAEKPGQESGQKVKIDPRTVDVTPLNKPLSQLQEDIQFTTSEQGVTASLRGESTQSLVNQLRGSELVQGKLVTQLLQAETQINTALSNVELPPGEGLLTARVPFPSGEGSLLQVGGLNLPVGLKKLAMEELPLVLNYDIDPVDTGLTVKLNSAEVDSATLPAGTSKGVHLGAVRAEVQHGEEQSFPVSGRVRVSLDDGSATRRALEKTNDPATRKALQARLQQIERLSDLAEGQNVDSLLDFMTQDRQVEFSGKLQSQSKKVADGTVHAWLTPDHDQDQRADVKLSGELYTAALDSMTFKADRLHHTESQTMKDGGVAGFLQTKIAQTVEKAAEQAVPKVMDAIRDTVKAKVQERFQAELGKVETQVDQLFDQTLDAAEKSTEGVGLNLDKIDVDPQTGALVASLKSDGPLENTLGPKITLGGMQSTTPVGSKTASGPTVEAAGPRRNTSSEAGPELVKVIENSTVAVDYSKPSVVIPGSSARRFLGELLKQEEVQNAFQTMTAEARQEVQKTAQNIEVPAGSVSVNVEVPFPSQKNVDSPLGPLPQLARKSIPFQASYQINNFGVDFDLQVKPVEVKEAVRPEGIGQNGVFIGAIQVGTGALTTDIEGHVQLQKGKTEGGAAWAEKALNEAVQDQQFDFQSKVAVGETESIFYVWVVPDVSGDGKADVAVAHRSVKNGTDGLQVQITSVKDSNPEQKNPNTLGGKMNDVVSRVVGDQLQKSGHRLEANVSKMLAEKVQGFLADGSNQMAREVNKQVAELYSKIGDLDIPVPEGMTVEGGKLSLKLGAVKVEGDAIVSEYGNENTARVLSGYQVEKDDSQVVAPGELRAHVPGAVFNRLLQDKAAGGPLDWNGILGQAADDSSAVKSLKLAKDDNGKTISPAIRVINGKPTLTIQLDGETNGIATPLSAGARLLPGFLGDGLGWFTDNTVGAVLGSRLQTEVQIPLNFGVENGNLSIKPGEVKFEKPEDLGFNIADILPTRLLSGLIVDGIASAFGPDSVNELLAKQDIKADLSDFGLQWTRVDVQGQEGKVPNLTVGVTLGQKLPEMVGQKAAEMERAAEQRAADAQLIASTEARGRG